MLISESRKFIYIAVPKTGSTSIEEHLISLDPNIQRNRVPKPNGTWVAVHKHARAVEVQSIMGDLMRQYTVVAFIRDPISTAVSKYYHYRLGRGSQRARQWKINKHLNRLRLLVLLSVILPLKLWVLVYPYSMTHEFILGKDGEYLVDYIGNFEDLQSDFIKIFQRFSYRPSDLNLPISNQSNYVRTKYLEDNLLKKIVTRKAALDVRIYNDYFGAKS